MIRAYKDDDLEQASIVLIKTFAEEPWNEEWNMELTKTRIKELMSGPMSIGYVYEKNNIIVGVMCGRQTTYLYGKEYFIDEFCILPTEQGKGIGSQMIKQAKDELILRGFVDIVLNTEKGYPSEKFYKKNKFEIKESLIFMYLDF